MPAPGARNLLLRGGRLPDLFRDDFDVLNPNIWTITDTYASTELLGNPGFETVTAAGPTANWASWTGRQAMGRSRSRRSRSTAGQTRRS